MHRFKVFCLLFAALLMFVLAPAHGDDKPTKEQRALGYFSLKKTIEQESDLDKILIIKNPKPGVEQFMKRVASVSSKYNEELDSWFKKDPSLVAKDDGFPPIEKKARSGIESSITKSMIFTGSKNFEVRMIVTQIQAADYIRNTFAALEDAEVSDARKERLKAGKESYEKLLGEAYQLLGAKK